MSSPAGDFAPSLAGQAQQQIVNISGQVTAAALKNVDKAGVQQNADVRSALNFIDGSNASVTVADSSGNDRVDVTVAVASSPTFSGTVTANELVYNGMRAHRHPYSNDRHIESGVATTSSGVVAVSFTSTFASTPHVTLGIESSSGVATHFPAYQSAGTTGVTVLSIGLDGNAAGSINVSWNAEGT